MYTRSPLREGGSRWTRLRRCCVRLRRTTTTLRTLSSPTSTQRRVASSTRLKSSTPSDVNTGARTVMISTVPDASINPSGPRRWARPLNPRRRRSATRYACRTRRASPVAGDVPPLPSARKAPTRSKSCDKVRSTSLSPSSSRRRRGSILLQRTIARTPPTTRINFRAARLLRGGLLEASEPDGTYVSGVYVPSIGRQRTKSFRRARHSVQKAPAAFPCPTSFARMP
eukprot:scaffold213_cov245-Pinguiococcus_pyrenoidosus.AAC.34